MPRETRICLRLTRGTAGPSAGSGTLTAAGLCAPACPDPGKNERTWVQSWFCYSTNQAYSGVEIASSSLLLLRLVLTGWGEANHQG